MGAVEHFLLAGGLSKSPKTIQWYREALTAFAAYCTKVGVPNIQPRAITQPLVLAWLDDLRKPSDKRLGAEPRPADKRKPYQRPRGPCRDVTVNNRFRAVRAFLNWCVETGYIKRSPLAGVKAPKPEKYVLPTFTMQQIDAMFYLCPPGPWWGDRDRALLTLILHDGLRRGEVAALQDTDIDWQRRVVRPFGKGDKQRELYLDTETLTALLAYSRHRDPDEATFFQDRHGRALTEQGIYQVVRKLATRAGVTGAKRSPHTGRHTYAVAYLRSGGNARMLQENLGHTSFAATARYTRTINAEMAMEDQKRLDLYGDRNGR